MRRTLGVRLVVVASLAAGLAACSSTPPPPTPAPTAEAATWDPRRDAIDQAASIWDIHQPPAYAYTFDHSGPPGDDMAFRYRVSGLEGDVQAQRLSGPAQPADATGRMTIEGLFGSAREAIASGPATFAYDRLFGYPTKLQYASAAEPSAGGSNETIDDFTTAADAGAANGARTALQDVLRRWRLRARGDWEYTWSRIPAGAGDAAPAVWTVRHNRKGTTTKQVSEGDVPATAADVGLDATAFAMTSALSSGGWVDVAVEDEPGLGLLFAVDPSPSVKGDAYWVRIAWTDLARRAAISDLEAAKARWATAQLTDYSYVWRFDGADQDLAYAVSRKGATATVKPKPGTPTPEAVAYATPRIEDTFAMIEAVVDQGGTVKATYDDKLGYPVRVEITPNGDAGAKGVLTIKSFKRR